MSLVWPSHPTSKSNLCCSIGVGKSGSLSMVLRRSKHMLILAAILTSTANFMLRTDAKFVPTNRSILIGDGGPGLGLFGCLGECTSEIKISSGGYSYCDGYLHGTGIHCENANGDIPSGQGTGKYGAVSLWDISKVQNLASAFHKASQFNADIGLWDVSSVTDMRFLFEFASKFNTDIKHWDVSRVTTTYGIKDIFGPSNGKALVGSKDKPTQLNFGLMRSRYSDLRIGNSKQANNASHSYGLQVTKLKKLLFEERRSLNEQKHYVAINFELADNIYTKQYSDRQSFYAQISSIFTLLLSSLAFFRFIKTYAELLIDNAYVYISDKRNVLLPEDVQHRAIILEEKGEESRNINVGPDIGVLDAKQKRRPSQHLSSFNFQVDDSINKQVEMVSIENPLHKSESSDDQISVALLQSQMQKLISDMNTQKRLVKKLEEQVEALRLSNNSLQGHIEMLLEQKAEQLGARDSEPQIDTASDSAKATLPIGWKAFESEDGRVYYQGPDGTTTWDLYS